MKVKEIILSNYRNYENEKVVFGDGINIIYGKNAQGKTNLLEGVYIFSQGRSYRAQKDNELIKYGSDFLRAKIKFEALGRDNECEIIIKEGRKKIVLHNKIPLLKTSELLGLFKVTFFGPMQLSLISGSPEGRRSLMDMHISSLKPAYYGYLKDYIKITKQKNNLLKQIMMGKAGDETLSVWNEKQAVAGAGVIYYRNLFINDLEPEAAKIHSEISGGNEKLTLKYITNTQLDDFSDKEKIREKLLSNIERKREQEVSYGQSIIGPHRDDIDFFVNSHSLKTFGSQGQQRTAVIAVKCAQTELVKRECGEYPVLLLDDIFSELDSERRKYLIGKIKNMQVIITCTEADVLGEKKGAEYFYIENGKISAKKGNGNEP